mmetsp:Transcript_144956/g.403747  ORF Transcript_144956/g.403747 Transcript_144956/m.403747 type:complete len:268 (-) Transcript_144956:78-881(-)
MCPPPSGNLQRGCSPGGRCWPAPGHRGGKARGSGTCRSARSLRCAVWMRGRKTQGHGSWQGYHVLQFARPALHPQKRWRRPLSQGTAKCTLLSLSFQPHSLQLSQLPAVHPGGPHRVQLRQGHTDAAGDADSGAEPSYTAASQAVRSSPVTPCGDSLPAAHAKRMCKSRRSRTAGTSSPASLHRQDATMIRSLGERTKGRLRVGAGARRPQGESGVRHPLLPQRQPYHSQATGRPWHAGRQQLHRAPKSVHPSARAAGRSPCWHFSP